MSGGIYPRPKKAKNPIWWVWWTEKVKDPKTGKLKSKKRYESSQSTRRSDANTLLNTKVYLAKTNKPRLDLADPTYEEVRDLWIASKPQIERRKDGTPTFQGRTHLDAFFGGWQAKNIDTPDIIALRNELLKQGVGESGVDHIVVSLRTIFNYAVKIGRLQRVQLPGEFPLFRPERKKEPIPIKEAEFQEICRHLPEPFKSGFILSYRTGMRLSEVAKLRWDQIDLAKRCLKFKSAKIKKLTVVVPLLSGTDKILAKLFRVGDLVFPGFDDRTARATAWRKATELAGFVGGRKGIEMRFTRTSFAHDATNKGIPIQRTMQIMGHKNIPTHMGYNVATEEDLELIRKLYDRKL